MPPERRLEMLALMAVGLERRRDDAEGEEGEEPGFNLAPGEEDGSCMILSRLTNTPCLSLHLKYWTPLTVPLCLPEREREEEERGRERRRNTAITDYSQPKPIMYRGNQSNNLTHNYGNTKPLPKYCVTMATLTKRSLQGHAYPFSSGKLGFPYKLDTSYLETVGHFHHYLEQQC